MLRGIALAGRSASHVPARRHVSSTFADSADLPVDRSAVRPGVRITAPGGFVGTIERVDEDDVQIRHAGGAVIVPMSLLRVHGDEVAVALDLATTGALVVPVVAETLDVERRNVTTGSVRITKRVSEREMVVDEPLLRERVDVHRVAINRVVDVPPQVRQDGDTTIVPVLEEVLVVTKRLVLKEELHLRRVRHEVRAQQSFALKREHAVVERIDASPPDQAR